jgi:hypothetical protein
MHGKHRNNTRLGRDIKIATRFWLTAFHADITCELFRLESFGRGFPACHLPLTGRITIHIKYCELRTKAKNVLVVHDFLGTVLRLQRRVQTVLSNSDHLAKPRFYGIRWKRRKLAANNAVVRKRISENNAF